MVYRKELSGYLHRIASGLRRLKGASGGGSEKGDEVRIVPIINMWVPTVYPFYWMERRDGDK
jgi:hypothetical protein